MWERSFWLKQLEILFNRRSIVWLYGARRSGKTVLCRMWPDSEYFDCELPRVRRQVEDPEAFWGGLRGKRVVLDEVHRLGNPSEVLKIAADHFPDIRVLATGPSTLGPSRRFRDTLTGRKHDLWLTPMITTDLRDSGITDLDRRFHRGGLPPFFLGETVHEADYQDWMDGFWAKDIQEMFRLGRRHSFQRFFEMVMANSGGIFEATRYAGPCEISRPTVAHYLSILEATRVAHILRPFNSRRMSEIVSAPKVYGFDTGFVCYHRGWHTLRNEDRGLLWEHFVLNEIQGRLQRMRIGYWRDKSGHEVDLVVTSPGQPLVAIECKASASSFEPEGLRAFLHRYPESLARVVAMDVTRPFLRRDGPFRIEFVDLDGLVRLLTVGGAPDGSEGNSP
ncbi:MAG: ATP-binding protein [Acidobacteria bacterium]|nr:ATP-binding protein [Acidobacteriota bacterium]